MSTSEIAKLESRWRENRQGLTFAPLAEAYRKMREPQRALEILAEGLALHAEYVPASIVLGRCHLDLGDDPAAEAAFLHVLGLDVENVIALKALAEITDRHSRFDEAENWLRQLLAIDRSNDEARAQLARVEENRRRDVQEVTAPAPAPAGAPADTDEREPPVAAADTGHTSDDWDHAEAPAADGTEPSAAHEAADDATPEAAVAVQAAADPEPALGDSAPPEPPAAMSAEDLDVDHFEIAAITPAEDRSAIGLVIEHEDEALVPGADLELRSSGYGEFLIASDADELGVTSLEANSEASDYQGPDAAAGLAGGTYEFDAAVAPEADEIEADERDAGDTHDMAPSIGADVPWSEPVAEREWAPLGEAELAPAADHHHEPEPEAFPEEIATSVPGATIDRDEAAMEQPAEAEPDLVVTESMAELYLRQGHHSEALTIYRELYLRNPGDLRLREKVDELETAEAAAESGELEPVHFSASETGGQSVASLFQQLLGGRPAPVTSWAAPRPGRTEPPRPEAPSAAAGGGEPTRPADDRLSLSSVFGDESSPVPPAVPGGASAAASTDGMSFDDFFDAPSPAAPTTRRTHARGDDDLDQFHAWLQNLKR